MREWLAETHGTRFELYRHFLSRFFDSEMVAAPEQTRSAAIAAVSLALPWFQLLMGPLKARYAHLSPVTAAAAYREAVRADELWLITLTMSIVGLLSALKWQSLFPDRRDYRVLGCLPLRARDVFAAKLAALLTVVAAVLALVNGIPSMAFPMLAHTPWRPYAAASAAGGAFFFFAMAALQGVLLNILNARAFHRVTGWLQGLLVGLMMGLTVLSFSIQPRIVDLAMRPEWSRWLPPVWFLGLCEELSGRADGAVAYLAGRALIGLAAAITATMTAYGLCYGRYRRLMAEGISAPRFAGRWTVLEGWLARDPRQLGVAGFMVRTLGRSATHRTIALGYGGLAFAVVVSGIAGMGGLVAANRVVAADFVYFHTVAALFLLMGARHLFSLPTELKANWIFQLSEREGGRKWRNAVDSLVWYSGAVLWIAPLYFEVRWLGWRGLAEAALSLVAAMAFYEWFFGGWNKLPFTCSHLPGKTAGWMLALRFFAALAAIPLVQSALLEALYAPWLYLAAMAAGVAAWGWLHGLRREGLADLRLKFEELPEAAVEGLNLRG